MWFAISVVCILHYSPPVFLLYAYRYILRFIEECRYLHHFPEMALQKYKLIFKCLITYFSVLYHGERFQIKGTFSKVHRQQKLSLYFPLSFLAKLQIVVTGQFCKPVTLLANSVHYLL